MPHQCTTCGRTFPDGSKEMLSGCPDCGGNKFQFKPAGATSDEQPTPDEGSPPSEKPVSTEQSPSNATERPPATSDAAVADDSTPEAADDSTPEAADDSTPEAADDSTPDSGTRRSAESQSADSSGSRSEGTEPTEPADSTTGSERVNERSEEDVAQASARSDVVSPDELNRASQPLDSDAATGVGDSTAPEGPRPDIDELRDELNEQFESIRIVSPGKYELNLMELYDRQEYIISLQEDGRYVIEMPDAWGIQDE